MRVNNLAVQAVFLLFLCVVFPPDALEMRPVDMIGSQEWKMRSRGRA